MIKEIEDITEYMEAQIWNAVAGEDTEVYISISQEKQDSLGFQWEGTGTYHDKDDNELFDFEFESGINDGSKITGVYPPREAPCKLEEEPEYTVCRLIPKHRLLLHFNALAALPWARDLEKDITYDYMVTGESLKVTQYYTGIAERRGVEIVSFRGSRQDIKELDKCLKEDPKKAMGILGLNLHEEVRRVKDD